MAARIADKLRIAHRVNRLSEDKDRLFAGSRNARAEAVVLIGDGVTAFRMDVRKSPRATVRRRKCFSKAAHSSVVGSRYSPMLTRKVRRRRYRGRPSG